MSVDISAILQYGVPWIIGGLLLRAVRGVDVAIAALAAKVDHLAHQDTKILIDLAGLHARVTHLELIVMHRSGGGDPSGQIADSVMGAAGD